MTAPIAPPPDFQGFASPSFTQVPDELFDDLMPQLSDCELRVLLYIIRRTFGFKRETDAISLSQMVSGITTRVGKVLDRGTGLSKATVARGLAGLRVKGVIVAERQSSAARGHEATNYRLRFRSDSSEKSASTTPLSQTRDKVRSAPLVSAGRHALSRWRDTQKTVKQQTDFEYSKGESWENDRGAEGSQTYQSPIQPDHKRSGNGMSAIGELVARRSAKPIVGEDRLAIAATIERLATELGDRAEPKASATRAMNLFRASQMGRDAFLDLLFQASGDVKDRRRNPGKAPLPRNRMAYFFAVVEDRLGLSKDVLVGEGG